MALPYIKSRKTTLLIVFLISSIIQVKLVYSQDTINTMIGSSEICPNTKEVKIPVVVKGMKLVNKFQLSLIFNSNVVNFNSYSSINDSILGGTFGIEDQDSSLIISWQRSTPANIINDTLLKINFNVLSGTTSLIWDSTTGNSFFQDTTGLFQNVSFENGYISVHPKMSISLTEQSKTCSDTCLAGYYATIDGGIPPYKYLWNGSEKPFGEAAGDLCGGEESTLKVIDHFGCEADTSFIIENLPGPKVEIKAKCKDEDLDEIVIYLENPTLSFSFEEVSPTHVIDPPLWDYGDGITERSFNPTHTYDKAKDNLDEEYKLTLTVKNSNGCTDSISKTIEIKNKKIRISNIIVPNSSVEDNRKFTIFDDEGNLMKNEFIRFEVYIFDRWGRRLFADTNYQNDWIPSGAPDGVYYYVVKTIGKFNEDKYKGSVTILGNTR
jgi:hypothetical protein